MLTLGLNEGEERRADQRYRVSLYLHWGPGDAEEVDGVVTDLSAGGCFVESGAAVSNDDLVKLRIEVPGRGDLTIWGNIIYLVRHTDFGVRFSAFSQGGARESLEAILSEESRRQGQ